MTPEASDSGRLRSPLLSFAFTAAAISAVLTFGQLLFFGAGLMGVMSIGTSVTPLIVGVLVLPQVVAVAALVGLWRYRANTPNSVSRQSASRVIMLMVSPAITILLFVTAGVARAILL